MSGLCQLAVPPMVTSPLDGARNPAIRCSRVDFPAPLGPSRPVTPWPMVIVMSLIATTFPYHRETLRSSMSLMLCLPLAHSCHTGLPVPDREPTQGRYQEHEQHRAVEGPVVTRRRYRGRRGAAEPLPHAVQHGERADQAG